MLQLCSTSEDISVCIPVYQNLCVCTCIHVHIHICTCLYACICNFSNWSFYVGSGLLFSIFASKWFFFKCWMCKLVLQARHPWSRRVGIQFTTPKTGDYAIRGRVKKFWGSLQGFFGGALRFISGVSNQIYSQYSIKFIKWIVLFFASCFEYKIITHLNLNLSCLLSRKHLYDGTPLSLGLPQL